jgi:hypothetical protein
MKNVFFSLAFMLIGSFAFAKNVNYSKTSNIITIENYSFNKINSLVGNCTYTIRTYTFSESGITVTNRTYSVNVNSQQECEDAMNRHVRILNFLAR